MSSFVHVHRFTPPRAAGAVTALYAALSAARTILGWPLRVHANRKLLNQLAGMSAHELADIGLVRSDLQDTSALPLDSEVGQFLSVRATSRRQTRHERRA